MDSRGLKLRFQFLTAGFSARDIRLLGALALELELTNGQFSALKSAQGQVDKRIDPNARHPLLEAWSASGLVYRSETSQRPRRRALFEPVYGVDPEYRQLVLRKLAADGLLDEVALETHRALEGRSIAPLFVALQQGDLLAFDRFVSVIRAQDPNLGPTLFVEALREAVCQPFDQEWFEQTWGTRTVAVAARILSDAAWSLRPTDGIYDWAWRLLAAEPALLSQGPGGELAVALAEHALWRGHLEKLEPLWPLIAEGYRSWVQVGAAFVGGDVVTAQRALTGVANGSDVGSERRTGAAETPNRAELGGMAALGSILLIAREEPSATAFVKRVAAARYLDDRSQRTAKALKTLLRYHAQTEAEHSRIDVHQVDTQGCVWELLLLALVVHMYVDAEWTRANWSKVLAEQAMLWRDAGYTWLSRQALFLARALNETYFDEHYPALVGEGQPEKLLPRSGEVFVSDLLTPKPDWAKQLDALTELIDASEPLPDAPVQAMRVVWYVDMVRAQLVKPALQEWRGANGWSVGRRVSVKELHEVVADLPEEDALVVRRSFEAADGEREWSADVYELLIDHPRVFNAARKRQAVTVSSGQVRIETREERGQVEVFVEPPNLQPGINVRSDGGQRLTVYRVNAATAKLVKQLEAGVRVPAAQVHRIREVLGRASQVVEVNSSHVGEVRTVPADARVVLRISPVAGSWIVQAGVKPFSDKGSFYVTGFGRRELSLYARGERLRCERDFDAERAALQQLLQHSPRLAQAQQDEVAEGDDGPYIAEQRWSFGEEGLLDLLLELRDAPVDVVLEWPESAAVRVRNASARGGLNVKLRRKKGWYLATGGIKLDDVSEVSLEELMTMPATAGGRFVRLPSGDYIEIEKRVKRVMDALRNAQDPVRGGKPHPVQVHESALATLQTLADSGDVDVDESVTQWLERVERVRQMEWAVPEEMAHVLRSYQVEGYRWLACLSELGLGACLADDMGLGKTVQLLALLLTRAASGPTLVVAPTSVCSNWVAEARRFAPSLRPIEYMGADRASMLAHAGPATIVVCSYGLLQQDAEALGGIEWGTVVLDEAQFIKNPESLRAKAAYRLNAAFRVVSTGTPVENHLGDLWSIFHFLNPDLLGTWKGFQQKYGRPIEREGDESTRAALRELVRPYVLRRTKGQVLRDLPPITTVRHEVRLSESETQQYTLLRKQIWNKLHSTSTKRHTKIEILAEITRLRRFCCHPRLVFPDAELDSSKIETFLELVEELRENDHRALVFSQFVDFLGIVRGQLDDRNIPYLYLDGSTPRAARKQRVDEFQEGNSPLFLISLKAGGFGLNLTAADYVIHLDPWWNPAVEAQATDRAHRIGQDRPVTVYRLVTKDTIEERIVGLHEEKRALAEAVLDGDKAATALPTDELLELIAAQ